MQGQRELERRARKSKRECMMLEKTGDTEGLQKASATLKQRQDALKQYCSDNGLSYKPDRTAAVGYNRAVAGKVRKSLTYGSKGGKIKADEVIGKSVGASAKNYPVKLPDGNHTKFVEGSTISKIKVFAGAGTGTPIRNAIYLESDYGIPADRWQKVRGEGTVVFEGKNRVAEIHWYEADNEKYDMKVKRWLDEG